jgi:hypothetical protein
MIGAIKTLWGRSPIPHGPRDQWRFPPSCAGFPPPMRKIIGDLSEGGRALIGLQLRPTP